VKASCGGPGSTGPEDCPASSSSTTWTHRSPICVVEETHEGGEEILQTLRALNPTRAASPAAGPRRDRGRQPAHRGRATAQASAGRYYPAGGHRPPQRLPRHGRGLDAVFAQGCETSVRGRRAGASARDKAQAGTAQQSVSTEESNRRPWRWRGSSRCDRNRWLPGCALVAREDPPLLMRIPAAAAERTKSTPQAVVQAQPCGPVGWGSGT
jgi:hypothetical protein